MIECRRTDCCRMKRPFPDWPVFHYRDKIRILIDETGPLAQKATFRLIQIVLSENRVEELGRVHFPIGLYLPSHFDLGFGLKPFDADEEKLTKQREKEIENWLESTKK